MIWLRSFIFALGQWLFTPVFCTLILLIFPLSPQRRYRIITIWARSMLWWLTLTCGIRYRVIGADNIPKEPCIVLSKHQSAWETLAFQKILPPQVWVLKRELLWLPFFGWGLALTSPIAINRSAGREALKQLVEQGKDRLAKGFCVVVFPEGTRIAPGEMGKFHIGGAWLAAHSGTPALPVALNAGEHWGKNSFLKKPGTITVSIGQPIATQGMKPDALNKQVEAWIAAEMPRLKSL
ncbi:MAG TPA: lysophospholipid acyltransferase family protein [Novimethylophilus sp.]|jgi:1-acyl-sn-glycerol-3-phosphate acyltransferase|uniref:lysophospholipid acyltransferase family protein n=1 Tax=Novimethylophilus sp. TaxID=2137426 RepID=UPI002F3E3892